MEIEFAPFPKIPRLTRPVSVTEKIDGTNGSVMIIDKREYPHGDRSYAIYDDLDGYILLAGSRTRWITPGYDNYGFATWVRDHADELVHGLGPGHHFGEWWGRGIQRNYGLTEKRFSLFNTSIWGDDMKRPGCCHVVPVLYRGMFDTAVIASVIEDLKREGSVASPGFMNAEGIMVYHIAADTYFKKTILKDESPKGQVE